MQPVSIRPLSTGDWGRWLPLWRGYQTFYRVDIADDVTKESFRRMIDPSEPTFGALAYYDEQALGLVHWIFHRTNWAKGDDCYLQDLYVGEQSRGSGIGRLLIEHVYAEAQKAGSSCVHWLTHETNATAQRLYDRTAERSGFIQYKKSF
jgi:ribosomal protein S18 acetylase RimI-like enzyme